MYERAYEISEPSSPFVPQKVAIFDKSYDVKSTPIRQFVKFTLYEKYDFILNYEKYNFI